MSMNRIIGKCLKNYNNLGKQSKRLGKIFSNTEWTKVLVEVVGEILKKTVKIILTWPFLSLSFMRFLFKQYWLQYQPLGYAAGDWPPVSLHAANHNPVSLAAQPSTHLTVHSSSLYCIILSMMMFKEILSKAFLKLKQTVSFDLPSPTKLAIYRFRRLSSS